MQEDDDDGGLRTELISQAKQSRSEKKARKALLKLGKAQIPLRRFSPKLSREESRGHKSRKSATQTMKVDDMTPVADFRDLSLTLPQSRRHEIWS